MNRKANGTAISTVRKALGISQRALAARAGIAAAYLSQIEHSERQPDPGVIRRLADELGVPFDAITYPVPDQVAS
jgi:XRE family transcriptional regulator, fatty acid utilization regulator